MEKTKTTWEPISKPVAVSLWISAVVLFVVAGSSAITSAFTFPGMMTAVMAGFLGMVAWGD